MAGPQPQLTDFTVGYLSDAPNVPRKISNSDMANLFASNMQVGVPASATAPGLPGQYAFDANYFYTCPATNTWVRCPLATWT